MSEPISFNQANFLPADTKVTPMLRQWVMAKEQCPEAILLFRMGDFYEMFSDDAVIAAPILDLALTYRDKEKSPIKMAGFPHHAATSYIAKLVESGLKVAICDQLEDPKTAKGVVKRGITRVVTPGTLVEEEFLQAGSNNFLVGLFGTDQAFGLSALDVSTGEFCATMVTKQSLRDELSRIGPAELIFLGDCGDPSILLEELSNANVVRKDLHVENLRLSPLALDALKSLIQPDQILLEPAHKPALMASLGLVSYVKKTQGELPSHIGILRAYSVEHQLLIDASTRANLDLLKKSKAQKDASLLGLMDEAKTPMGSRAIVKALLGPSTSLKEINRQHELVLEFFQNGLMRQALRESLAQIYDLERLTAKAASNRINPREMAQLRNSLLELPKIQNLLSSSQSVHLALIRESLTNCFDLSQVLSNALTERPPLQLKDGGIFLPGYDEVLDELTGLSAGGLERLIKIENQERERTKIPSLKIRYTRVFGYYIEITRAHLDKVPGDYVRKQTIANGERFVTSELSSLEAEIASAEQKKQQREQELFEDLRHRFLRQSAELLNAARALASLDKYSAFAEVAVGRNFVCPHMLPKEEITLEIEEGRHPVVEAILEKRGQLFVANDLVLDGKNAQIALITGPNMAGKSTIMRQAALIQILAQAGSFVPAKAARLSIIDRLFARVGAYDDLSSGRSTFMVEMSEAAHILHQATPYSLIILDEIGRGTSTYDGLSIAQSVAEYIHDQIRARTLFATHYHELTTLEKKLERLHNLHVEVDESSKKVRFLYSLKKGPCDQSYGIQVARLAGLPSFVLDRAQEILQGLENQNQLFVSENEAFFPGHFNEAEAIPQLDLFGQVVARSQLAQAQSFFNDPLQKLIQYVLECDINKMTPLQALNKLASLQKHLKKSEALGSRAVSKNAI